MKGLFRCLLASRFLYVSSLSLKISLKNRSQTFCLCLSISLSIYIAYWFLLVLFLWGPRNKLGGRVSITTEEKGRIKNFRKSKNLYKKRNIAVVHYLAQQWLIFWIIITSKLWNIDLTPNHHWNEKKTRSSKCFQGAKWSSCTLGPRYRLNICVAPKFIRQNPNLQCDR